jgi:starch synthase
VPTAKPLQILFATSEIQPLIKTGGLGDVSGSLPTALRELGADVRVLVPGYPAVLAGAWGIQSLYYFKDFYDFGEVHLLSATLPDSGVPLIIIEYPLFYARGGGPYQDELKNDWPDNARRFALLSRLTAFLGSAASPLDFRPDIVQCNDWQTGLAPAYLRFMPGKKPPTVMTIHNLAFQGIFPPQVCDEVGLPPESFGIAGAEYYGNLSFLKAGLFYADHITTVSSHYAWEIQHDPLGFGMQGLLQHRREQLTGIVNGIDIQEWNPLSDVHLAHNYDDSKLEGKAADKKSLQAQLGLSIDPDIPLLGAVSRISYQKGLDLLLEIAPALLDEPVQIVILGTGDAVMEQAFIKLAHEYPGKVAAVIGFDEALSHQIEAGLDIFLMPSRFEPCGLNQMYSQRYGTPPVVHATGGLVDTVTDTTKATLRDKTATGFMFDKSTSAALHDAVKRALDCYRDHKTWRQIQRTGMRRDFSWGSSAEQYLALYRSLLEKI